MTAGAGPRRDGAGPRSASLPYAAARAGLGILAVVAMLAAPAAADPAAAPEPADPFPVALGGPFVLTDHTGAPRSEAAPGADLQLLFFGYANCEQICSAALPLMAGAVDRLAREGLRAVPVMITVDPERDTVAALGPALAKHHRDFVGLTGPEAELARVRALFGVETEVLFHDPEGAPVYAHGSHVYLLDATGKVLTLLPPVLSPDRMAAIAARYAGG